MEEAGTRKRGGREKETVVRRKGEEHEVLRVSRKCFIHAAYAEVPSPLPPPVSLNARTVNVSYQTSTISRGEVNSSFPKCGGHVKLRVYPETNLSGWPLTPSPLLGAYLSHVFQPASNRAPLHPSPSFLFIRVIPSCFHPAPFRLCNGI